MGVFSVAAPVAAAASAPGTVVEVSGGTTVPVGSTAATLDRREEKPWSGRPAFSSARRLASACTSWACLVAVV